MKRSPGRGEGNAHVHQLTLPLHLRYERARTLFTNRATCARRPPHARNPVAHPELASHPPNRYTSAMNRLYFRRQPPMAPGHERVSRRQRRPRLSRPALHFQRRLQQCQSGSDPLPRSVGAASQAQFHAFTDTWSWADAAEIYDQFIDTCPNVAVEMIKAFHCWKTRPRTLIFRSYTG